MPGFSVHYQLDEGVKVWPQLELFYFIYFILVRVILDSTAPWMLISLATPLTLSCLCSNCAELQVL